MGKAIVKAIVNKKQNQITIKEVIGKLIKTGLPKNSMCCDLDVMYYDDEHITSNEMALAKAFIKANKPKWYNLSFWDSNFINERYWWNRNELGRVQRIEFLKKLLKKLK